MEVEIVFNGQKRNLLISPSASFRDIMFAVQQGFCVNKLSDETFEFNVVNDDGSFTRLDDPKTQLSNGTVIDIQCLNQDEGQSNAAVPINGKAVAVNKTVSDENDELLKNEENKVQRGQESETKEQSDVTKFVANNMQNHSNNHKINNANDDSKGSDNEDDHNDDHNTISNGNDGNDAGNNDNNDIGSNHEHNGNIVANNDNNNIANNIINIQTSLNDDDVKEHKTERKNNANNTNATKNIKNNKNKKGKDKNKARYVVRLRGLPWSAREGEIYTFFDSINNPPPPPVTNDDEVNDNDNEKTPTPSDANNNINNNAGDDDDTNAHPKAANDDANADDDNGDDDGDDGDGAATVTPQNDENVDIHEESTKIEKKIFIADTKDKKCKICEIQIVFLTDGRASGEALVEFEDQKSFQLAFGKNREHIGHRYIEIFKSTGMEIDTAAGRATKPPAQAPKSQYVIRMRGLPYSATDDDVMEFFQLPRPTGIHLIKDDLGRPSGEGFVEFATELDAIAAMAKHRHHMAHRYIELFRSSPEELMRALGLTSGWSYSSRSGPQPKSTCVLMRGLPYSCTESDITKFFQEIDITPIRIHRKADGAEAYVEFYTIPDTDKAMTRHRNYIGRRYIELFRVTYEDMARTVGLPVANTNIPASALSINSAGLLHPAPNAMTISAPHTSHTAHHNAHLGSHMNHAAHMHVHSAVPQRQIHAQNPMNAQHHFLNAANIHAHLMNATAGMGSMNLGGFANPNVGPAAAPNMNGNAMHNNYANHHGYGGGAGAAAAAAHMHPSNAQPQRMSYRRQNPNQFQNPYYQAFQ